MATVSRGTGIKANEVQRITVGLASGSYTITFNGSTTVSIAYNATTATVQTALSNLASVGSGNVTVGRRYDNLSTVYVVQFIGSLAGTALPQMTTSSGSVTVTTLTDGASNEPILTSSDPTLYYAASYDPGTVIVMCYQNYTRSSTAKIDSITDSAGNTYDVSTVSAGSATKGTFQVVWCRLVYAVTSSTSISINTTGTQLATCVSQAFWGINPTYGSVLIDSGLQTAKASPWTTAALTPSRANGFMIGIISFYADYTLAVNTITSPAPTETFLGYADGLTATTTSIAMGYSDITATSQTTITLSASAGTGAVSYERASLYFYELSKVESGSRAISI